MSEQFLIEIYRGSQMKRVAALPFLPIVEQSLTRMYNWDLRRMQLNVTIVDVPDDSNYSGLPIVENLVPNFGFAYITVMDDGRVIYQHPHPLEDIVTRRLQQLLREKFPEETLWGFRLDLPGMPPASYHRPTPEVQGGFSVRPLSNGEKPRFQIRKIEEEQPPFCSLKSFDVVATDEQRTSLVKVVISKELAEDLIRFRSLSDKVEEGGFLLGRVYSDEDNDGSYIVEIKEAPIASNTGASLLHFTFTGDSFAEVRQTLRESTKEYRIVGWYHTHLFPATETFGLSSIDNTLHFNTFRIPWQVAGLINIDFEKRERVLRFYVRKGQEMALCPHWVHDTVTESNSEAKVDLKIRGST
jgi:hypothetical protein